MIYHITTQKNWEIALSNSFYDCESLQTEGFIHTSTFSQVKGVYERYYNNLQNLVVLCIMEEKLQSKLVYEKSTNDELYPHIFGTINCDAVVQLKNIEDFI